VLRYSRVNRPYLGVTYIPARKLKAPQPFSSEISALNCHHLSRECNRMRRFLVDL